MIKLFNIEKRLENLTFGAEYFNQLQSFGKCDETSSKELKAPNICSQ